MTDKATYTKPATQVDLETRLANGNASGKVLSTAEGYVGDPEDTGREFAVEDNDTEAYLNVNPEYQTYANETEKPILAESGPEAELEDKLYEVNTPQAEVEDDDTEEEEAPKTEAPKTEAPKVEAAKADASKSKTGQQSS